MEATGPDDWGDGRWSVAPGEHSCSSYYKAQSAQKSPPSSSPILWCNLQLLEPLLCLCLLGICVPTAPEVSALLVSSAPRKGLGTELAQWGFVD